MEKKYSHFQHPNVDILKGKDFLTNDLLTYHGGTLIDEVEKRFAKTFGFKYALSTASGTTAIYTMFKSIGLKEGDEVLVQAYTFFATATPLFLLGCKPILVDTLDNGNIDPKDLEKKITKKTKAVAITHLWGIPCDLDKIQKIVKKHKLLLVEDCSHSHGATYNNISVGNFGICSAWSVGAKKNISGGVGGMFCTNNLSLYQDAILLNHFNRKDKKDIFNNSPKKDYVTTGTGLNLRLHPFSAFMINEQLKVYDKTFKEKKEVAEFVIEKLSQIEGIELPYIPKEAQQSYYALSFLYNKEAFNNLSKNEFIKMVNEEGAIEIDTPNTTCPLNSYKIFQNSLDNSDNFLSNELPNAYKYHSKVFKMPVWYGNERFEYAKFYINAIKKVLKK
ncbi:MAG TPA: aminotransferase class V-fold PLP-dependent enzyme [Rickettsiales bacterium]|nr:aminotransferase class V-fold PLP-dependent enzyme [Rickettsiales bacterium]